MLKQCFNNGIGIQSKILDLIHVYEGCMLSLFTFVTVWLYDDGKAS